MKALGFCAAPVLASVAILALAAEFPSEDLPGAKDPPLLSRYSGARLVGYSYKEFDDTILIAGKYKAPEGQQALPFERTIRAEGKVTKVAYNYPANRSGLEVMRNYRAALQGAGMTTVFSCDQDACGGADFGGELGHRKIEENFIAHAEYGEPFNDGRVAPRYVLASRTGADGAVTYAAVYVVAPTDGQNGGVLVELVEPAAMETGKVKVDLTAEQMAGAIAETGKVALYGIYFETDKSDLQPNSKRTLSEMANVLTRDPKLNVFIVGHTDNQGSYAHNVELSQRRADAVVAALSTEYKIDLRRLVAKGVASVAPVASNDTGAGRAKNRRVEMVKQ